MPETPIDQSAGIQSIRLKVPTGTVPIPPAGYAQLHSPSPGTLALRLPDGSVVPVGGGGGVPPEGEFQFNGHSIVFHDVEGRHELTLYPEPGSNIKLAGPVTNQANEPFLPVQATTVPISSAELLALHTTPKLLTAAPPGAAFAFPLGFIARYFPGATAYTGAGDVNFSFGHGADPGGVGSVANLGAGFLGTLDQQAPSVSFLGSGPGLAGVTGEPIKLALSGPITDGDGTVAITTLWVVV